MTSSAPGAVQRLQLPRCDRVGTAVGIDDGVSAAGIEAVREVPGRVEPIDVGQGFLVVVDYAHTPDSIHTVLQAARPLTSGRLFIVFGCGGDRDREKRPLMGRAATPEPISPS